MQMAVTKMFSPRNFVCPESVLDGISIAICDKFAQGGASEVGVIPPNLTSMLLFFHCSFPVSLLLAP